MPYIQPQPIPPIFFDSGTGNLFRHCKVCERDLMRGDIPYGIEKVIRRYPKFGTEDVIFDYAICMLCIEEQHRQMSEESRARMEEYYQSHMDVEAKLQEAKDKPVEYLLDRCAITGEKRMQMEEYHVSALCVGDRLHPEMPPHMLGGKAMEDIAELMSRQTLDQWNRFRDQFLGPSPEISDLLKDRPVFR